MSILTFREIQRQVQAKVQNNDTSTANSNDILPKIKDWINTRYNRIYRSHFWEESMDNQTKTLTASTDEYSFDRQVGRIFKIFDQTHGREIFEDTVQNHVRNFAVDLDKTGNIITDTPIRYRRTGIFTAKTAIASVAEKVDIVSSSVLDVAPNVVHIEGEVGGVEIGEDVVLTGTSSATSTNTYDASQKLRISVGTSTGVRKTIVGKVTVSGTTSSTTFAEISPAEFAHKYQWFKVSPTPNATGTQPTWLIWYQRAFRRMDDDNDIPILDCCDELVQGAYADSLREDGLEEEARGADQLFTTMVKELQATRHSPGIIDQFRPPFKDRVSLSKDSYLWVP